MVIVGTGARCQRVPVVAEVEGEVVQGCGVVDLRPLVLDDEVLLEALQQLLLGQPIEVLDHAVVVNDGELIIREAHGHEVVVLLVPTVIGVLATLLIPDQGSSGRAVVTVGDVEGGHLGEELRDAGDVLLIIDDPELVTEAVQRCDEAVDGLGGRVLGYDGVDLVFGRVGEEDRLDIGIVHAHVLHAVLLLILAGQLMLLDDARHVVLDSGADDEAVLRLPIHRLGVDVVVLLGVLDEPALVAESAEVLSSLSIDRLVMLIRADGEVDLRADDMVEGHLVALGLGTSLLTVEDVVGTRGDALDELLRGTYAPEWFDDRHSCRYLGGV